MKRIFVGAILFIGALVVHAQVQPRPPGSGQITGVSGNAHALATVSGPLTAGDGVVPDANGNLVDTGAPPATGGGAPTFPVNAQTATYQVLAADFAACKTISVASGTFTVTLVASGSQPATGQCIDVINYGTGVITIARSGQNINGGTSSITVAAGSATAPTGAHVVSDGTNYTVALWGGSSSGGGPQSSYTTNGTTAGFSDYAQGTDSGAVAPCNTANSICWEAPTSVTAYLGKWPAAQPASGLNFLWCSSANPTVCSFVAPSWSMLVSATAGLTLSNGTNATEFDQTSAAHWTWANKTASTSLVNQSSPIMYLCGQAWEGASPADTQDCWTIQNSLANFGNPVPSLVIAPSGGASTQTPQATVAGVNFFYDATHHNSNVGGSLPTLNAGAQFDVAIGQGAMGGAYTGTQSVAIGYQAGTTWTLDYNSVAVGYGAGGVAGGAYNNSIGHNSGPGTAGTTFCEYIGEGATSSGAITDCIVIGQSATTATSHRVQLGGPTITSMGFGSNVVYPIVRGTATFTTATSDAATVTGATASSNCSFTPTNSTSSTNLVGTYISSVTTNSVTITHPATVDSGGTGNVQCTLN